MRSSRTSGATIDRRAWKILNWVGFNESNSPGSARRGRQAAQDAGSARATCRQRSRSTFARKCKRRLQAHGARRNRLSRSPTSIRRSIADPTWMEARSVYLDIAGRWGSVRAGRDIELVFSRQPVHELRARPRLRRRLSVRLRKMFGGACGHVGFGTLWPDYRAQITYTTPNFGDVFQLSVGMFDPRTVPTYSWDQTPIPRIEGEAVANYSFREGFGVQSLGQRVLAAGRHHGRHESGSGPGGRHAREFHAERVRRGRRSSGYLGPVKAGFSGYLGQGMDGFVIFTFNPVFMTSPLTPGAQR